MLTLQQTRAALSRLRTELSALRVIRPTDAATLDAKEAYDSRVKSCRAAAADTLISMGQNYQTMGGATTQGGSTFTTLENNLTCVVAVYDAYIAVPLPNPHIGYVIDDVLPSIGPEAVFLVFAFLRGNGFVPANVLLSRKNAQNADILV